MVMRGGIPWFRPPDRLDPDRAVAAQHLPPDRPGHPRHRPALAHAPDGERPRPACPVSYPSVVAQGLPRCRPDRPRRSGHTEVGSGRVHLGQPDQVPVEHGVTTLGLDHGAYLVVPRVGAVAPVEARHRVVAPRRRAARGGTAHRTVRATSSNRSSSLTRATSCGTTTSSPSPRHATAVASAWPRARRAVSSGDPVISRRSASGSTTTRPSASAAHRRASVDLPMPGAPLSRTSRGAATLSPGGPAPGRGSASPGTRSSSARTGRRRGSASCPSARRA